MNNDNKISNLKEKLRQALASTFRVISDDFIVDSKPDKKTHLKNLDLLDLDALKTKNDFIKARADFDSAALKKKFSDEQIYKKNLPSNLTCKKLYSIAEKIRYESLGGKILRGIKKNFKENYNQIINQKSKDKLKSKEDVLISEAFELYMLKKFHNIKLNDLTNKMLSFWEKRF